MLIKIKEYKLWMGGIMKNRKPKTVLPNAEIRFLRGRVKFIGFNSKEEKVTNKCGQHDSMLVIFRSKKRGKVLFAKNDEGTFQAGGVD